MKLHLGCGDVYLKDYLNIDIDGKVGKPKRASSLNNYYKGRRIGNQKEKLVDVLCDIRFLTSELDIEENSVDEIVCVQTLEHFTFEEARDILKDCLYLLKEGGILFLDIPDVLKKTGNEEWMLRLIYGSQKDYYSIHKSGYTMKTIVKLLKEIGFKKIEFIKLFKHDNYPSITLKAIK